MPGTSRRWWLLLGACSVLVGCRLPPRGEGLDATATIVGQKEAGKFWRRSPDNPEGIIIAQAGGRTGGDNAAGGVVTAGGRMASGADQRYRPGPQVPPQPLPYPTPWSGTDPHQRHLPSVFGERLELGPAENPLERVVELTRELEATSLHNRTLLERIQQLEAHGQTREQALAEAVRQVEAATQEVARARTQIEQLQNETAMLQAQIRQMEKEDVELLRTVIQTLEKLLGERR